MILIFQRGWKTIDLDNGRCHFWFGKKKILISCSQSIATQIELMESWYSVKNYWSSIAHAFQWHGLCQLSWGFRHLRVLLESWNSENKAVCGCKRVSTCVHVSERVWESEYIREGVCAHAWVCVCERDYLNKHYHTFQMKGVLWNHSLFEVF